MIGFKAHPRGLLVLFFTEMWERFSFYGMSAILVLYLVLPVAEGGLGYSIARAATIFGNYTMTVYLFSMLGGYVADRFTGAKVAVFAGGSIIALGHFSVAFGTIPSLYVGLGCVALGTGLLKPNVSSLVGELYPAGDHRRDAGFSLYYTGINVGAFLSPFVCGYLAQDESFRGWLRSVGLDPKHSWHWGFGAAGVGMIFGLVTFARAWRTIPDVSARRLKAGDGTGPADAPITGGERVQRFAAIGFFCVSAILFFAMLKQSGSSMNLFADQRTRCEVWGWAFPSSWFQSVGPAFVILLAPLFSMLWLRLGTRQPSSPTKAVLGLLGAGLSFAIMVFAAKASTEGRVGPLWLLVFYGVLTMGELCLSPVGLSNVARLSPPKIVGLMVGIWFVAIGLGGKLAGVFAAKFGEDGDGDLASLFGRQAIYVVAGAVVMSLLIPWMKRVIRRVDQTDLPPPAH